MNEITCLQVEARLKQIDINIRRSLTVNKTDIEKCKDNFSVLENIPLNSLILKKCPWIICTIKKCRRYDKCPEVKQRADRLYRQIQGVVRNMSRGRSRHVHQASGNIRRSKRIQPRERVCQDYLWKKSDFRVQRISDVDGRGVIAQRTFKKGEFLLHYEGILLSKEPDLEDETYVFEFKSKGKRFWIDATSEDGTLGRLLNDENTTPNCVPKVIQKNDTPTIGFFALRPINKGEEIRYSYGSASTNYPWRSEVKILHSKGIKSLPLNRASSQSSSDDNDQSKIDASTLNALNSPSLPTQELDDNCQAQLDASTLNAPISPTLTSQAPDDYCQTKIDASTLNALNSSTDTTQALDDNCQAQLDASTVNAPISPTLTSHVPDDNCQAKIDASTLNALNSSTDTTQELDDNCQAQLDASTVNAPISPTLTSQAPDDYCQTKIDASTLNALNSSTDTTQALDDNCQAQLDASTVNAPISPTLTSQAPDDYCQTKIDASTLNALNSSTDTTQALDDNFQAQLDASTSNAPNSSTLTPGDPTSSSVEQHISQPVSDHSHRSTVTSQLLSDDHHQENSDPSFPSSPRVALVETNGAPLVSNALQCTSHSIQTSSDHSYRSTVTPQPSNNRDHSSSSTKESNTQKTPADHRQKGSETLPSSSAAQPDTMLTDSEPDTLSCIEDSESNYEPSEESDYDSDTSSSVIYPTIDDEIVTSSTKMSTENSSSSVINLHYAAESDVSVAKVFTQNLQEEGSMSKDSDTIQVMTTSNDGGRSYNKMFFCPYCGVKQSKLPRHLVSKHPEELDVAKYRAASDEKVRKQILMKIRNLGNHLHNYEVIRKGSGTIIVAYRPKEQIPWYEYAPCEFCMGYYAASALWKHQRCCQLAPQTKRKHQKILPTARLLLPTPAGATHGFTAVLASMRSDKVGLCCKNDRLIIQLGERLFLKHGHDRDQYPFMRNTLRELGRLLLHLRNALELPNANLEYFIDPTLFREVVSSARGVAGFSDLTHQYDKPTLALKIGGSLKKCAKIKLSEAMVKQDRTAKEKASEFFELCNLEWSDEIAAHAHHTLNEKRRNKIKLMPLIKDVTLLAKHLETTGDKAYEALDSKNDDNAWDSLSEATLASIILFNRRRQGEASKITLKDFANRHQAGQSDVVDSLSELEKSLCKKLQRIEIIGKRGRVVPVILTAKTLKWLNMLITRRSLVGVHPENKFVFARRHYGSHGHIRGSDVLRSASEKCGAKYPELLRSTKLRKQVATMSQVLNLKDHELDILANFMGHDIRVHRQYYRLPEETMQVAKVSKVLLSLEGGQLLLQKGRSLDEIDLDPEEEIDQDVSDCDPESSDEEEPLVDNAECPGPNKTRRKRRKKSVNYQSDLSDDELEDVNDRIKKMRPAKGVKRPWSEREKTAVLKYFYKNISSRRLPGKKEIENCSRNESCLKARTWRNIKDFVRNKIASKQSLFPLK